jgi:hypothetical protein
MFTPVGQRKPCSGNTCTFRKHSLPSGTGVNRNRSAPDNMTLSQTGLMCCISVDMWLRLTLCSRGEDGSRYFDVSHENPSEGLLMNHALSHFSYLNDRGIIQIILFHSECTMIRRIKEHAKSAGGNTVAKTRNVCSEILPVALPWESPNGQSW